MRADSIMDSQKYEIPTEFKDQLYFGPAEDTRIDEEILDTLTEYREVTSEKNIWAFWHSGIRSAPAWCQRNVCSWVRMHSQRGWTIRVLDNVPESENNALKYLSSESLPKAVVENAMDGPYLGAHSADSLRGALLYTHGGVFSDVGNMIIRNVERICWSQLEDPDTPYRVAAPWVHGRSVANHFVAARKGDPFIYRWHKLFCHLWEGHTNSEGVMNSPLMAFLADQERDMERSGKFQFDFTASPSAIAEYVAQIMCWQRICLLEDVGDGFSGVEHWSNNVLLWDVLEEDWGAEAFLGWNGIAKKMFDLFAVPLEGGVNEEEERAARSLVWRLLSGSGMQKIVRGKGLTREPGLGELLDRDVTRRDAKAGTYAGLLRYGCENFTQVRNESRYVKAPRPEKTLKKGLLEP